MTDQLPSPLDFAARRARLLRRHVTEARRIARNAAEASASGVTRIYGESIVADLGERRLALAGLHMALGRIAIDVEEIRYWLGLRRLRVVGK